MIKNRRNFFLFGIPQRGSSDIIRHTGVVEDGIIRCRWTRIKFLNDTTTRERERRGREREERERREEREEKRREEEEREEERERRGGEEVRVGGEWIVLHLSVSGPFYVWILSQCEIKILLSNVSTFLFCFRFLFLGIFFYLVNNFSLRFSRRKAPQSRNMRDLNKNWYLIFAWGTVCEYLYITVLLLYYIDFSQSQNFMSCHVVYISRSQFKV